ncbi:flagellar basal body rod protein FlgB [Amphibiibacter pelophylacis]|uniref:Flagellar basal body rod protein FlgB n=1 Tax=Amphibiibacter pelophylacis TaxID=1799477 RepID=A0ACC6P0R5_9BURK
MSALNRLTQSLDFQALALQMRAQRQQQIASNIANADTPGYVARDMDFSAALRAARGGSSSGVLARPSEGVPASGMTQVGHMPLGGPGGGVGGSAVRTYALQSQDSLDRNTVDMDRERASFVDNALRYEAALRSVQSSGKSILDAMRNYNQG